MSQERLNGLATCSIEKDILTNVDLNIVLNEGVICFEMY
jgi:hypothetical protein